MEMGLVKADTTLDFTNAEIISTLKATVAYGLNDAEFALFAEHCKATRLNPFKKEVWAIKGKGYTNNRGEFVEGKLQIMTGINGFFTIANGNNQYDGIESGLIDPNGDYKTQAYPKNDFIGAWAKVYRKDRRVPVEAVAMLAEYDKSRDSHYPAGGIWRTMKRVMITKCAESVALRKALPQELNGLYTQEEMPPEFSATAAMPQAIAPAPKLPEVVVADKLPAPANKVFRYDLRSLPDEQRIPLDEWMDSKGLKLNDIGLWESPKEIKRLADYLVPDISPEAQERVAALRARIENSKKQTQENA